MAAGSGLVFDIVASVRYHLVMRRRHRIALLVVLGAVTTAMGSNTSNSTMVESETNSTASGVDAMPKVRKSPRVFVNTSVPFSVAPQPVKDTIEVAHAKQQFMKTFRRIQDAVIAADHEHLNYTLLDDDLTNNLDDRTEKATMAETTTTPAPDVQARTSFAHRGPVPFPDAPAQPPQRINIFPDPILEPEYFLPSVHVDQLLMDQLDPPLPLNPYIQQIRPISDPGLVGTCYEIILLEPEQDLFSLAPQASQIIPVGTPALPGASSRKPVPHFKAPQLFFPSLFPGGAQAAARR